jgi:hypothetical protein
LGTGGRISGVGGLDSAGLDDNDRLGGGVVVVGNARPSFGGDSDRERCRTTAAAGGDGDTDIDRRGDGGATVVAAAGDFERDLERDFAASGLEDLTEAAEEAELRRFPRRRRRAAAALADFTLEAADFSLSLSDDDDDEDDDDEDDEDEDEDDLELSSSPSPSLSDELLSSELVELFSSSELSTAELSSSEFFFPPPLSLSSL